MNRISSIDGWRCIAAVGVLWTHTWATTQFQSLKPGGIDLFKAINILGNGVHLFFVISGFCMYLVMRKKGTINLQFFIGFIKKRWIRIAPAFYFACIIICLYNYLLKGESLNDKLLINFVFIQNHLSAYTISPPFWSLGVEWHFYLILPLLILIINYIGFFRAIGILSFIGILINLLHYTGVFLPRVGWWYLLPENMIHFFWGILLSYLFSNRIKLPKWTSSNWSIVSAFLIANFGKFLFSKYAIDFAGQQQWIVRTIGPTIMTFGFSWLIHISLNNDSFAKIIGNRLMAGLGRISYSFYLWHAFILEIVFLNVKSQLVYSGYNPIILFILTMIILIPTSYLSYYIFERFYFKRRAETKRITGVVPSLE